MICLMVCVCVCVYVCADRIQGLQGHWLSFAHQCFSSRIAYNVCVRAGRVQGLPGHCLLFRSPMFQLTYCLQCVCVCVCVCAGHTQGLHGGGTPCGGWRQQRPGAYSELLLHAQKVCKFLLTKSWAFVAIRRCCVRMMVMPAKTRSEFITVIACLKSV